ncbi:hypothetical protein [Nocardia mangyaensis]|uniref:hypothetical protein n=1 Tax=Nocardia mangyaensis TaxID=2213200 RepID=UPI002675F2F9|nr:hypothetical protein [Nocardia mangyaensis]MDO3647235.1 hypothetical protein [Nocardia mangyaensis]
MVSPLPAHNYRDQNQYPYEYGEQHPPHRCGGACGRPGCRDVPQGYSHTVPIRDEGYGQPVDPYEPIAEPTSTFRPPRTRRTRALVAVLLVLGVTGAAGLIGAKLGSDIDLFGAPQTAVAQSY